MDEEYEVSGDIVGDDDLDALIETSGEDDDDTDVGGDIVGAVRRARQRTKQGRAIVRSKGLIYQPTKYGTWRESVLGVDSVATVAAAATSIITVRPQVPFRAERFMVSSGIAASFLINDIKIGKNSQFPASGAVPASAFSELAVGSGLQLDTAEVAQDIVVSVTNISAGALRFTGAFYGKYVQR